MDPVTHTIMSAALVRAVFADVDQRRGLLLGVIAGTFPDIDVLFRSLGEGPLDGMLLHRHFTHSVFFAPAGALVCVLPFLFWKDERERWRRLWGVALTLYLAHLFMDVCTSYGTLLFWPFSGRRHAFDVISICDPILIAVFFAGLVWSFRPARPLAAVIATLLAVGWLTLGWSQRDKALELQKTMAAKRGHVVTHGRVTPMLFSITRWRSIYRTGDTLVADSVETPFFGQAVSGDSSTVPLYRLPSEGDPSFDAQMRADVAKFSDFADGFVAVAPGTDGIISDMRYSLNAGAFRPLWGIRPRAGRPAEFVRLGDSPLKVIDEMSRDGRGTPASGKHAKP
ncbi:MAG TPA: metal-dependent hydrolase [Candidatus Ozemobacteraceae bacterium]|nr:metal-dependent hydrolase [Candidatus Ozemobacteraceae bacterium]HQG29681.1 metal-dependent hydrolase [Candidatus Ozemobacteraceae bacterium]